MHPYIGVTGFMHRSEVKKTLAALNAIEQTNGGVKRKLMIGVLACAPGISRKPNHWLQRHPNEHDISDLFFPDRRVLNILHYHADDADSLAERLKYLTDTVGPHLDGIQLNMTWPPPSRVYAYGKPITLELGKHALGACNHHPQEICSRLQAYKNDIARVLVDMSGGHGIPLSVPYMMRLLVPIAERFPNLGIGVAGGLSLELLDQIEPLIKAIPHLSIDAEGALRDAADHLDLERVQRYLERAYTLFN